MVWERLSAPTSRTGRGSAGSPDRCHHGEPAVHAGLDAPGRNARAARPPGGGVCRLRAGGPAHSYHRALAWAGTTAVTALAFVAHTPDCISAGVAVLR